MLRDKLNKIREILQAEEDFMSNEREIINLLPENNEILNLMLELEDMIAEVAYLEGYKQAIKEQAAEQTKETYIEWLSLGQAGELLERLTGIKAIATTMTD